MASSTLLPYAMSAWTITARSPRLCRITLMRAPSDRRTHRAARAGDVDEEPTQSRT